jgi:hypothetical protein
VASQVELLALYWRKRVEQHGSGAELCLSAAVAEMVTNRSLRARRMTAAAPDPAAFDAVLKDGVVTLLPDVRLIAFRHHILFDYAASRLFIDSLDIAGTVERPRLIADARAGDWLRSAIALGERRTRPRGLLEGCVPFCRRRGR